MKVFYLLKKNVDLNTEHHKINTNNTFLLLHICPIPQKSSLVHSLALPFSGGHFWYPLSSKAKVLDENMVRLFKYGSWATSSGHADWYTIQTVSPDFGGDFSNLSCFLVYKVGSGDEKRCRVCINIEHLVKISKE